MNHTTNYNLPQWEATDAVKREDMNAAMSAIDAALSGAGNCSIGYLTYTGTGAYGEEHPTVIRFPRTPLAFFIVCGGSVSFGCNNRVSVTAMSQVFDVLPVTWDGNAAYFYSKQSAVKQSNASLNIYHVVALYQNDAA